MLTLTLLRHAKSSWDDDRLDDFDRPLAPRGLKAAPRIGQALAKLGPPVDLILCSTAKRTRQTLDLVLREFADVKPKVQYDDALYHGLPESLLECIVRQAGRARHVLLIGHNPGLEILALRLTGKGSGRDIAAMTAKFPTAAVAQFTFACSTWAEIEPGSGTLRHFLTPRTLP